MNPGAFRFFLASLVVISHYTSLGIGRAAVLLFFTLSGYWVYQMWVRKYTKTKTPYLTYILSRTWRLAPVFLLCSGTALIICMVLPQFVVPVVPFREIGFDAIVSSFIILGYNSANNPPLAPGWSLDIELQFYLIAPIIIAILHKRILLTTIGVITIAVVGVIFWGKQTLLPFLPFFLVGMIAAQGKMFQPVSRRIALTSAVAVAAVLVIFIVIPVLRPILFGGSHPSLLYKYNDLLNILITLLAIPFVLNTVLQRSNKLDSLLADASYSLYLFHWLPILIVGHYFPQIAKSGIIERAFWTLLVLALTYAISIVITVWIDRPLSALRTRFVISRLRIQVENKDKIVNLKIQH